MQFNSMCAWKDAYRASLGVEQQVSEFELSDTDLEKVQGAAGTSASANSGLDRLRQIDSYLQSSNGSVLPLGSVSQMLGNVLGSAGGL
jgi:hypothetical protein